MNNKYFPESELVPANVGATSFSHSVLRCLQRANLSAGVILYKRDEELDEPRVHIAFRSGLICAILEFNFRMGRRTVSLAIAKAATLLMAEHGITGQVMIYYQTDALLGFHPEEFACCVTHHGPFVHDFVETFSADETGRAFGDANKALHLFKHQELGLSKVRSSKHMFVLQHSHLQREYLVSRGVDEQRIHAVRPPITLPKSPEILQDEKLRAFVEEAELLVFTAVARLDYFKNVELLVEGGIQARKRGIPLRILVVGDRPEDDVMRERLRAQVPAEHEADFMATAKLSKPQLYALFNQARPNGIFVCSSRYETLGITPLEAALSGVCTLMIDSDRVEARRFFPSAYRFLPSSIGLADVIERMYVSHQGVEHMGKELQRSISADISEEKFERDTLSAWGNFSRVAQRLSGQFPVTEDHVA
ncbi:glycosyltransferase [Streptosporangium sp. NPDC001559]|uniref:glycosyltransferase n=1 Tax=Streptosporangium sp. NPDC001559 TaxID=3366187 RepID=UPI0036E08EBD